MTTPITVVHRMKDLGCYVFTFTSSVPDVSQDDSLALRDFGLEWSFNFHERTALKPCHQRHPLAMLQAFKRHMGGVRTSWLHAKCEACTQGTLNAGTAQVSQHVTCTAGRVILGCYAVSERT